MNVSIAMATYSGARFLREQLESLAGQTLPPAELVVCDDGSADRTLEIVAEFAAAAPFPIHVHRNEERLGYADNFLKAAGLCTGDFISFCDQDDGWREDKLARCAAPSADPAVLHVVHSADVVDADLRPTGRRYPNFRVTRAVNALRMDPWYTPYAFAVVFLARLKPFLDAPRPQTYYGPLPQAHDQWVYFLSTALGRSVFLADSLALYRQHGRNSQGADVTDMRQALRLTAAAGGEHYRWLIVVADGCAVSLRALAARHGAEDARLQCAADYYADLALTYERRAGLYREGIGRLRRMMSGLLGLVQRRGYRSRDRGGLGAHALVKDTVSALAGL